ncbi:MAG TPA: CaiB/BaiF CoA-transferase family protein [Chloroflexota bacterium]|nr:CaiB/BaiF CoA-transferase family protein [Chloroflexota bacterium]
MPGPLSGVRAVELASYITGPFACQMLADLGAEVIKIEPPGEGEPFRAGGYSSQFIGHNHGKRSLALDLKAPGALEVFERLVSTADVLLENFRPGVADRLGAGYERVRELNPRIIYCSISGFGESGPYVDRPSYNEIGHALSGLWSQTVRGDDLRPPGPAFSDPLTGVFALHAILAALYVRERTGQGQRVTTSMLEATMGFLAEPYSSYFGRGNVVSKRPEYSQAYGFWCGDGQALGIHLSTPPKFWQALVRTLGREDLIADPRFATVPLRIENYDAIQAELAPMFATRARDEWLELLHAADVPCAPIYTVEQALADPQVRHLGIEQMVEHPTQGTVRWLRFPAHFSATPLQRPLPPPTLGEHTEEILGELGFSPADVERLRSGGAV